MSGGWIGKSGAPGNVKQSGVFSLDEVNEAKARKAWYDPGALKQIADLLRWYNASQITGLADNDPVSQWDDLSSNANHATQATSANRPLYKTNIANGNPVLRFDGSDDGLEFSKILDSSGSVGHMFVVAKGNSAGGIISTRNGGTGWSYRYTGTTTTQYYHTGSSPNISYTVANQLNILEVRRNGLTVALGANGTLGSATAISGYTASAMAATYIGYEEGSYLSCDIAEIAIYSRLLTADERAIVLAHLKMKYAIA